MRGPDVGVHVRLSAAQPPDRTSWVRAAAAVLRKSGRLTDADPDERVLDVLNSTTVEGLRIIALGTPDSAPGDRGSGPVEPSHAVPRTSGGWDIRSYLKDPDPHSARAAG